VSEPDTNLTGSESYASPAAVRQGGPPGAPAPIRIVSTDFDGTLYAPDENPPTPPEWWRRIRALQAQGVKWIVNTGRDMASWRSVWDPLAETAGTAPDGLILVEREIYERRGGEWRSWEEWNRRCREAHEALFRDLAAAAREWAAWARARGGAVIYEDPYSPLCIVGDTMEDAEAICGYVQAQLRRFPEAILVRNDVYARLAHRDFTKGAALRVVAERLGVGPENVFAAGDHLNDLSMLNLRAARRLAAPANAVVEVKEAVRRQGGWVSRLPHARGVLEAMDALSLGGRGATRENP